MISSPPNGEVDDAIALLQEVVQLFRATLAYKVGDIDLPIGQVRVLSHLFHQQPCTVGEVAAGIGVSLATASEAIDRLVDAGWARRGVNPADRRQVVVTLTEQAIALADRVHAMRRRQIGAAFEGLDEEERRAFNQGLRAVIGSLNDVLKPGTTSDDASDRVMVR